MCDMQLGALESNPMSSRVSYRIALSMLSGGAKLERPTEVGVILKWPDHRGCTVTRVVAVGEASRCSIVTCHQDPTLTREDSADL